MKQTFTKSERLSSKKIIDSLFEKGSEKTKMVFHYPFRVVYQIAEEPQSTPEHTEEPSGNSPLPQILISVSKRYFKKAVDRNLIKRRFREAYRKNKEILLEKPQPLRPANVAFVYIAKEIEPFEVIEKKLKIVLSKIG